MEVETDGSPFKVPAFDAPEVEDAVTRWAVAIGQKVKLLPRQPCGDRHQRKRVIIRQTQEEAGYH